MSPFELLAPEAVETVPFSVRLVERRLSGRAAPVRTDRRAHPRRSASDLDWLQAVRLTGGTNCDVRLIDLSEGGALLEVDAPLRPGLTLTLEMTGPGLDAAVPLEVLRCYIASLRGETTIYRGACAFAHLIELPGKAAATAPATPATKFIGTDAALNYLLERCTSSNAPPGKVTLERMDVLHVLDSLQARTAADGSDPLSRHTSDLLTVILPALRDRAPREVVVAALEERMRGLPQHWRTLLQPTSGRLVSLIEQLVTAVDASGALTPAGCATPEVAGDAAGIHVTQSDAPLLESAEQPRSSLQRIVVRHTDGEILRGYTQDFHPSRAQFSLWPSIQSTTKERVVVRVARLKAVFFVRDFKGNPHYQERQTFGARTQGRRVEVTFSDGEVVLGTTLNYRPDGQGFFVSPADPASNNIRVFVVAASVRRVRFL